MKLKIERFEYLFFWIPEIYFDRDYSSGSLKRPFVVNFLKWHFRLEK